MRTLAHVLTGIAVFDCAVACFATYKEMHEASIMLALSAIALVIGANCFGMIANEKDGPRG